jgi:hypothetical protein
MGRLVHAHELLDAALDQDPEERRDVSIFRRMVDPAVWRAHELVVFTHLGFPHDGISAARPHRGVGVSPDIVAPGGVAAGEYVGHIASGRHRSSGTSRQRLTRVATPKPTSRLQ